MPASPQDYQQIQQQRQQAAALNKTAGFLTSNAQSLSSNIMDAIRQDRQTRGSDPVAQQTGQATGAIIGDNAAMRGRLQGVDPTAVAGLADSQRAQNIAQISMLDSAAVRQGQAFDSILQGGANTLMAAAAMKKAEAEQVNAEADSLLEMLRFKMEEEKFAFDQQYKNSQLGLEQQKLAMDGSGGVELKGAQATDMQYLRSVFNAVNATVPNYRPEYSGFLNALGGKFQQLAGNMPKQQSLFNQNLSDIATSVRQYISGAAISEQEAKVMEDLIPSKWDSDNQVQTKLEGLKAIMTRKGQAILDTAGYNVDANQYFNTTGAQRPSLDQIYSQ